MKKLHAGVVGLLCLGAVAASAQTPSGGSAWNDASNSAETLVGTVRKSLPAAKTPDSPPVAKGVTYEADCMVYFPPPWDDMTKGPTIVVNKHVSVPLSSASGQPVTLYSADGRNYNVGFVDLPIRGEPHFMVSLSVVDTTDKSKNYGVVTDLPSSPSGQIMLASPGSLPSISCENRQK